MAEARNSCRIVVKQPEDLGVDGKKENVKNKFHGAECEDVDRTQQVPGSLKTDNAYSGSIKVRTLFYHLSFIYGVTELRGHHLTPCD